MLLWRHHTQCRENHRALAERGLHQEHRLRPLSEALPGTNVSHTFPNSWPFLKIPCILCKDADKAYVEYVLQDYNKPMGVATYKATQERLRELLPPEEEMKRLIFPEE